MWDNGRKRLYQTPRLSSGLTLEVTNDHSAGRLHAESFVERSQVVVAHEIDHVIALQLINHSPDQFSSDLAVLEIRQDLKQWYVGRKNTIANSIDKPDNVTALIVDGQDNMSTPLQNLKQCSG